MSSAIYLWDSAVAVGLEVDDFAAAERAAYKLYYDHQDSCDNSGNAANPLQQWIDDVTSVVSNPQYADHFGEELITEAKRLQAQLQEQPQAVLELDILLQLGGGDSLDRVIYEAVKQHSLGIYDPRYPLWSNMANQLPAHGVDRVLASLPRLSAGVQHIRLNALEVPRNNRAAVELMQNWFENHPIGKLFTSNVKKDKNSATYFITFTRAFKGELQIIKFYFGENNYIQPDLNFILDLKDRFLTQEQQQDDLLASKFMFRFIWHNFFSNYGQPNQDFVFKGFLKRWNSVQIINTYFTQLNEWLNYILDNISTPDQINTYLNYRQDEVIEYIYDDYMNFNIAAIVQDPNLPKLYQQDYDALPIESDYARNKLKQYYEQDIVEISQIVAAKND